MLSARCGLLWIGEEFYTPDRFVEEARTMGISRRIARVPREFKLGETWVMLGHRHAVRARLCGKYIGDNDATCPQLTCVLAAGHDGPCDNTCDDAQCTPGIISAFRPLRVELILKQSDATPERIAEEARRDVTVVPVPDDDPDHNRDVERQWALGLEGE